MCHDVDMLNIALAESCSSNVWDNVDSWPQAAVAIVIVAAICAAVVALLR